MGYSDRLESQTSEILINSKSLRLRALLHEKEEKAHERKVKRAMKKGSMDEARMHAEKAIYNKREKVKYIGLSSRLDAVCSFLNTPAKMNTMVKSLGSIVKTLESSLATASNVEKMSEVMEQLEKHFQAMGFQEEFLSRVAQAESLGRRFVGGSSSCGNTGLSTPEMEVNSLMQQVADDIGLKVSVGHPAAAM